MVLLLHNRRTVYMQIDRSIGEGGPESASKQIESFIIVEYYALSGRSQQEALWPRKGLLSWAHEYSAVIF